MSEINSKVEIKIRNAFSILRTACFLLFAFLLLATSSQAQISVDNVILRFSAGQHPVQNVNVRNNSNKLGYVTVEVTSVTNPGKNEKAEKSKDLIASPKAFSIEANGVRAVRLLVQSAPIDEERIFRVSFIPQDKGFGDEYVKTQSGRSAVIRVLSGMGMLVFVDPTKPVTKLDWTRSGDNLVFENTGNVNIYLADGVSCPPGSEKTGSEKNTHEKNAEEKAVATAKPDECPKLETKRLYAGQKLELQALSKSTVTYLRSDGGTGDYQKIIIPPGDGSSSGGVSEVNEG